MRTTDHGRDHKDEADLHFANTEEDYETARKLITEYAESLDFSLEFQDFDTEIINLNRHYGPPTGFILLARFADQFVGVTCLRNLGDFVGEIKRMYIQPAYRGKGFGRKMLNKTIEEAKMMGYRYLRLDTVPDMESANELYRTTGFYEIEDYGYNPLPGARFMEYKL